MIYEVRMKSEQLMWKMGLKFYLTDLGISECYYLIVDNVKRRLNFALVNRKVISCLLY